MTEPIELIDAIQHWLNQLPNGPRVVHTPDRVIHQIGSVVLSFPTPRNTQSGHHTRATSGRNEP